MSAQNHQGNVNWDGKSIWNDNSNGQPVKLFVGQLPGHYSDVELKAMFTPFGNVTDAHILKDRSTGMSKGCGFIGFADKESADKAIASLHEKICLQQGKRNLQVKYAGKEEDSTGHGNEQITEWKLFVGMLAKTTDEDRLRTLFEKYGPVKEVYLMRDANRASKGCAFIKYSSREHAVAAIAALHEVFRDEGAPRNMTVKFAETKADRERILKRAPHVMHNFPVMDYSQQSHFMHPNGNAFQSNPFVNHNMAMHTMQNNVNRGAELRGPPGANVFVYNVPDSFTDADLGRLFSNYGMVLSSKVFIDKATGKPRGFGFVSYASPSEADTAIQMLNNFDIGPKKLKVALKKNNDHNVQKFNGY